MALLHAIPIQPQTMPENPNPPTCSSSTRYAEPQLELVLYDYSVLQPSCFPRPHLN